MKIIISPNAFKGSLSAPDTARAISAGIKKVLPDAQTIELPIADGGDGTLELILGTAGGKTIFVDALDPFGKTIKAPFGILPDGTTAVIEMAAVSGLRLVPPDQLNPMKATTYGTGQLIQAALDHGCTKIIIGVGGSATVDGGIGMAQALGIKLLDSGGSAVSYGGDGLAQLDHIDASMLDSRLHKTEIIVACDVENLLTGAEGAARVFGPQKGATPEMVEQLDVLLERLGNVIQRDLWRDVLHLLGAGAAGGLAAGLVAFLNARIESGAETLLNLMDFEQHIQGADLLITGEGRIDAQTAYGKGPMSAAKLAKKYGVPVIALAGGIAEDANIVFEHGIDGLMPIVPYPMLLDEAIQKAPHLIEQAAERLMRLLMVGKLLETKTR